MSFNANMSSFSIIQKSASRTASGAIKEVWTPIGEILIAITKTRNYAQYVSQKYSEATHIGLTYKKGLIEAQHRLMQGDREFIILEVIESKNKSILTLKELVRDVKG